MWCKMGAINHYIVQRWASFEKWAHLERNHLSAIFYRGSINHPTTRQLSSSIQWHELRDHWIFRWYLHKRQFQVHCKYQSCSDFGCQVKSTHLLRKYKQGGVQHWSHPWELCEQRLELCRYITKRMHIIVQRLFSWVWVWVFTISNGNNHGVFELDFRNWDCLECCLKSVWFGHLRTSSISCHIIKCKVLDKCQNEVNPSHSEGLVVCFERRCHKRCYYLLRCKYPNIYIAFV